MTSLAYAALWVFVFSLPWQNTVVIPGVGAISRLVGILALGLALLAGVVSGRLRRWHGFHIAALLFVVWTGAVLLVMHKEPNLPNKFHTYVQLALVLWMVWELAPSRQRQLGLLVAYVLGAYVAALSTIMVYRRQAGSLHRFAAEGIDPNDLANTLALALPMAWYLGTVLRRPLWRWVCRAYLPVGLITIGLTGSRGGMLAALVGLLIVPLAMTRLSPKRLATGILLLVASGVLAIRYIPETTMQRLASTRSEVQTGSLGGRMRIWKGGVQAFLEQPVVGHGAGSFQRAVRPFLGFTRTSHNSFLTVLVEQGIVGFLLYTAMFGMVFLAVLNLPMLERRFALVLLATLGVAMLPVGWEDSKPLWFVLAALFGLSWAHIGRSDRLVQHPHLGRSAPIAASPMAGRPRQTLNAPFRRADRDATA